MAVDVHEHVAALLLPVQPGGEVLPGVVFEGVSTELGVRLRMAVGDTRWWVDIGAVDRVRRWAARTDRLALGYRTEGGRAGHDQSLGLRMCQAVATLILANEAAVLTRLEAAIAADCDPVQRVRHIEATQALDDSGLAGARYYTINPYVGCVIGCRFCYAQSPIGATRALMGLADHTWGSFVDVRTNLPELLRKELAEREPMAIKFCPIVGDSYQPAEKKERVTRGCLEAIADADPRWTPLILTRSTLILRDLDVLARIENAWAGVSLPTADDTVRKHFEPRAASVSERLDVLTQLRGAGVSTLAVVQPMMAGDPEALADALVGRANAVVLDVLAEEEGATGDFDDARFAETRTEQWQRERALHMRELLRDRGIDVWRLELPPEFCTPEMLVPR